MLRLSKKTDYALLALQHLAMEPMTFTACSPTDVRCDQFATCAVRDPLWPVKTGLSPSFGRSVSPT